MPTERSVRTDVSVRVSGALGELAGESNDAGSAALGPARSSFPEPE